MKNYRLNSTAADSITDEDVANTLADMPDEVAARVKDELIVPLLTSGRRLHGKIMQMLMVLQTEMSSLECFTQQMRTIL